MPYCRFNEAPSPKQVGMCRDVVRSESRLQILQRAVDAGSHFKRVGAILARNLKDHSRLSVNQSAADCRRRRPQDVRHVLEANTPAALVQQDDFPKFVRRQGLAFGLHDDPLIRGFDKARAAYPGGCARRRENIADANSVGEQSCGIDLDLKLLLSAPQDRDLRDSGHRKKTQSSCPVRKRP